MLGESCFIRRCRTEDALFVTDAPRRAADPEGLLRRLERSPDWTAVPDGGLTRLDPSPALWGALMRAIPPAEAARPERWPAYPFLVACANRLCFKPVAPEIQPVAPLRLTLKRLEAGELDRLQAELPQLVAALQREKKPLPEAAGRIILHCMSCIKKE